MNLKKRLVVPCLLGVTSIGAAVAAQGIRGSKPLPAKDDTWIEVRDGSAVHRLWLDPELIAELDPADAVMSALLAESPGAEQLAAPSNRMRLWRCDGGELASSLLHRLRERNPDARFAEMLHFGGGPDAPRTFFPGGVVVQVDPALEPSEARDFLITEGLEVRRELVISRNFFVIDSRPGLEALELADRLRPRARFLSATPVQWTEVSAF